MSGFLSASTIANALDFAKMGFGVSTCLAKVRDWLTPGRLRKRLRRDVSGEVNMR